MDTMRTTSRRLLDSINSVGAYSYIVYIKLAHKLPEV